MVVLFFAFQRISRGSSLSVVVTVVVRRRNRVVVLVVVLVVMLDLEDATNS